MNMSREPTREEICETLDSTVRPQLQRRLARQFSSFSAEDIEEIITVALEKVYMSLEKRQIAFPTQYLYLVAMNVAKHTYSSNTRFRTLPLEDRFLPHTESTSSVDAEIATKLLVRCLEIGITLLAPQQQVVLLLSKQGAALLSFVESPRELWESVLSTLPEERRLLIPSFSHIPLSDEEIAKCLDLTENNVRVLRHRAMRSLEQIMVREQAHSNTPEES